MNILTSAALTAVLIGMWVGEPSTGQARSKTGHTTPSHSKLSTMPRGDAARTDAHQTQTGKASVYARNLHGRRTADGSRFDADSNGAASKTLPLGTTAQVTNLENGRTATVEVRDRGPHKRGRIIDVSPGTATALGMDRNATASVSVTPMATH